MTSFAGFFAASRTSPKDFDPQSESHLQGQVVSATTLLTMRTKAFLVVSSLCSIPIARALPSTDLYQPLSGSTNSTANDIVPICFSPLSHPGIETTNAADCNRALRKIVLESGFLLPLRFSKNPRRLDVVKLPVGWRAGNCVIFVTCSNLLDSDIFRYADIAAVAKNTIKLCVDVDDPHNPERNPYGGLEQVGDVGTFYVSVGSPKVPPRVVEALSRAKNSIIN